MSRNVAELLGRARVGARSKARSGDKARLGCELDACLGQGTCAAQQSGIVRWLSLGEPDSYMALGAVDVRLGR